MSKNNKEVKDFSEVRKLNEKKQRQAQNNQIVKK